MKFNYTKAHTFAGTHSFTQANLQKSVLSADSRKVVLTLSEGLALVALKRSHSSRPRNSIIAEVSFKGGYIDAWGRGSIKIYTLAKSRITNLDY